MIVNLSDQRSEFLKSFKKCLLPLGDGVRVRSTRHSGRAPLRVARSVVRQARHPERSRRRILFLARTEVESQKSVLIINTDGIHE
jgi:hypothetical protein